MRVVDHFVREGIARRTVYNALNRRKNGQSILEATRSGRPSSRTSSMKVKVKRLDTISPKLLIMFDPHLSKIKEKNRFQKRFYSFILG